MANEEYELLRATYHDQCERSRKRLGLFAVSLSVAAPFLVWGGMEIQRRRKAACSCSIPGAHDKGRGGGANGGGTNGTNGTNGGANGSGANGGGANGGSNGDNGHA
ncbi:MAG: hypothetical protein H6729_00140 [Deltaproteobacteria bacterium]|nr:hypothetical protein [Deltaproteobacteria bacterium]